MSEPAEKTNKQQLPQGVSTLIWRFNTVDICVPQEPLNSWQDGGHLTVTPRRHITDRTECYAHEAIELMAATMLAGRALLDVLQVEKVNYQEMGNWSLGKPKKPWLHVHVFGRARQQSFQVRGESIRFFPQGHAFYRQIDSPISPRKLTQLRLSVESNLSKNPIKNLLNTAKTLESEQH
ncbi:MAG: diadenosine tetraphosphate (Ap4A) HIT family hydrolase [Pseudohongiellaceae bacterium]